MTENTTEIPKNTITPVDASKVFNSALEPGAPSEFYEGAKIVGLYKKELTHGPVDIFRVERGEGENIKTLEIPAVTEEVERYKIELKKIQDQAK